MSVNIAVSPDIDARIEALAAKWGLDKSDLVRDIIEKGIDDVELYPRAADIRDAVLRGEMETYSSVIRSGRESARTAPSGFRPASPAGFRSRR